VQGSGSYVSSGTGFPVYAGNTSEKEHPSPSIVSGSGSRAGTDCPHRYPFHLAVHILP